MSTCTRIGKDHADFRYLGSSIFLGAAIASFPLLLNSNAYFRDDIQSQYMPIFYSIGKNLLHGQFTPLTLQMQNGGALLAEYQYAMLNPISLASYVIGSLTGDLAAAAAVIAIIHLTLLCLGAYVLGRAFGITPPQAVVAASAFTANNFIFYWYASSWIPGLISLTWFVWAAVFLMKAPENRANWALSVAFTYLAVSAGWPHTVLMLGLFAVVAATVRWVGAERRGGLAILSSFVCGCMIASPSVFPVLAMSSVGSRATGVVNKSDMVINLYYLVGLSSPFQFGQFKWGSLKEFGVPALFCSWFILPLLPFIGWRRSIISNRAVITLVALAALTVVATQGPDTVGSIRTPIRFIPFLHLFLLLLFGLAVSLGSTWRVTRTRTILSFGLVGFGLLSSIQIQPTLWMASLIGTIGVAVFVFLFIRLSAKEAEGPPLTLILGTLAILCLTRALVPTNANLPEWLDKSAVVIAPDLSKVPEHYSFLVAPFGAVMEEDPIGEDFGAMSLVRGNATILGYSPIGLKSFAEAMCVETHGFSCPEAAAKLVAPTSVGPPLADLLRIDEIRIYHGDHFDRAHAAAVRKDPLQARSSWGGWTTIRQQWLPASVQQRLDAAWALKRDENGIRTYVRRAPKAWPAGSVAWSSTGLQLKSLDAKATRETIAISASRTGGTIIFTRLAWPGYRAEFNGRPVAVRVAEKFLVAVDLPKGSQDGVLVLRYEPPLVRLGLMASAIGALAFLGGVICWARIFKPKDEQSFAAADARPVPG